MDEAPDKEAPASPLSVGLTVGQRDEINRLAAEYGASIGRPVSVAEFVRIRLLGESQQFSAAA